MNAKQPKKPVPAKSDDEAEIVRIRQAIDEALFECDLDEDTEATIESVVVTAKKALCKISLKEYPRFEQLLRFEKEAKSLLGAECVANYFPGANRLEVEIPR